MPLVYQFSLQTLEIDLYAETSSLAQDPHAVINLSHLPDTHILGGGGRVLFQNPGTVATQLLTSICPIDELVWEAAAQQPGFFAPPFGGSAVVEAFCVVAKLPATDYVRVENTTPAPTNHPTAEAFLPAGFVLIGGGAKANRHQTSGAGSFLVASRPGTGNSWFAAAKDHLTAHPTVVTAYALGLSQSFLNRLGMKVIRLLNTSEIPVAEPTISSSAIVDPGVRIGNVNVLDTGLVVTAGAQDHWSTFGNMLLGVWPRPAPQISPDAFMWTSFGTECNAADPSTISTWGIALVKTP
jgi:hypothetical protein